MSMDQLAAIMDKSLLQRVCEPQEAAGNFGELIQQRYRQVAPLILHEETFDNLVQTPKDKSPAVVSEMVRRIKAMQPHWMDDVWEISYRELVLREELETIPLLNEEHQRLIWDFRPEDPKSVAWLAQRRSARDEQIEKRILWQKRKIPPGQFFLERDERRCFQMIMKLLLQELSRPDSKMEMLHTFLERVFVKRHPEREADITAALDRINDSNINDFKFSRNWLLASLIYLIAPITKVLAEPSGKQQPLKLLDRQNQRNNLADQEYVASAFLCGRLLTGDEEMAKVMRMFETNGLWPGQTIWIDRKKDLAGQIPVLLV